MRFRSYSYRFAEEVLNSKMSIKKEIENIITNLKPEKTLRGQNLTKCLGKNWLKKDGKTNL